MRFQLREHKDLIKALENEGYGESEVFFVKKRGRVHVQIPDRKATFYFFRRRSMKLDEPGQFNAVVEYTVNDEEQVVQWKNVLERFQDRLSSE